MLHWNSASTTWCPQLRRDRFVLLLVQLFGIAIYTSNKYECEIILILIHRENAGLDLTPDFLVSCGTDQRVILWLLEASSSPANSPSVTPVTRSLHFSKAAVTSVPDLSGVKILSTSSNEVTVVTIGVGVESICFQLPTIWKRRGSASQDEKQIL